MISILLIDGIPAALYTRSPINVFKDVAAGTGQFIKFGMHHSSISMCVSRIRGNIQPEPIQALAFSWHFSPLEYVLGLAYYEETRDSADHVR